MGVFQRRCKPGLSHVRGTGIRLRQAGTDTATQVRPYVSSREVRAPFPRVYPPVNVVEAFPNAYLAVLLPGQEFLSVPHLKRGRKFDWLYERCVATDIFKRLVQKLCPAGAEQIVSRIESNRNHDERAALICLLTAAGVATGKYTAVGDPMAAISSCRNGQSGRTGPKRASTLYTSAGEWIFGSTALAPISLSDVIGKAVGPITLAHGALLPAAPPLALPLAA